MTRSKLHELYFEANNLLYGLRADKIIVPTNEYREVNVNRDLLCKIYQKLSETQQKGLDGLLSKLIHTLIATKNNEISFKLKKIEELNLAKNKNPWGYRFKVHFIDNLNGDTLLFIPTYKYASGIGKHEIVEPLHYTGGKVKDNSIVSAWAREDYEPMDIDSWGYHKIPAYITLYTPPSYIEDDSISIYVKDDKDLKDEIKEFKNEFMKNFIQNGRSPIVSEIEDLLGKGYELLKEETEKNIETKIKEEIKDLKGEIF